MLLFPTMFPGAVELTGPKHSTRMPLRLESALALSVDVNEGAFSSPNPVTGVAVYRLPGPHWPTVPDDICGREQNLVLLATLQSVVPNMVPLTVQVKVMVSSGQVGGAGVNCPATSPGEKIQLLHVKASIHEKHVTCDFNLTWSNFVATYIKWF